MARIWDENDAGGGNRGTTDPINTMPTFQGVEPPTIGPGFTPWVDRWDDTGPNTSGTKPGNVPSGTRPLYNNQEWTSLSDAERNTYLKAWGQPGNNYGGGGGGGSSSPFDISGFLQGFMFDDPATSLYETLIKKRLSALDGPLTIPGLEEFTSAIRGRMGELSTPLARTPEVSRLLSVLSQKADQTFTPNAELETALKAIAGRITELNAPPFTALEEKGQEVKAYDQLEQAKQAARQQIAERMAARGIAGGSGIIESAIQQSDRVFDQLRQRQTNDLLQYRTEVGQERKDKAIDLGVDASALRGTELTRKDTFDARQLGVLGQLAQITSNEQAVNETRKDRVVDLAGILSDVGFDMENLTNARGTQQLQVASLLPDLVERRLQMALAALSGGTVNMAPLGSQLSGILSQSSTNRSRAPVTDWSSLFLNAGNLLGNLIPQLTGK